MLDALKYQVIQMNQEIKRFLSLLDKALAIIAPEEPNAISYFFSVWYIQEGEKKIKTIRKRIHSLTSDPSNLLHIEEAAFTLGEAIEAYEKHNDIEYFCDLTSMAILDLEERMLEVKNGKS